MKKTLIGILGFGSIVYWNWVDKLPTTTLFFVIKLVMACLLGIFIGKGMYQWFKTIDDNKEYQ